MADPRQHRLGRCGLTVLSEVTRARPDAHHVRDRCFGLRVQLAERRVDQHEPPQLRRMAQGQLGRRPRAEAVAYDYRGLAQVGEDRRQPFSLGRPVIPRLGIAARPAERRQVDRNDLPATPGEMVGDLAPEPAPRGGAVYQHDRNPVGGSGYARGDFPGGGREVRDVSRSMCLALTPCRLGAEDQQQNQQEKNEGKQAAQRACANPYGQRPFRLTRPHALGMERRLGVRKLMKSARESLLQPIPGPRDPHPFRRGSGRRNPS